jgi:tetratricopeptide (TPR) repeat protein
VAIDDENGTLRVDEQSPEVRKRRAAVLAGVGLVWAAFMVSIGLFLVALLVLVGAAAGAAWIFGLRLPPVELRGVAGRQLIAASRARGTAAYQRVAAFPRRFATATRSVRVPQLPRLHRRPDPRVEEALASNSEGIALAKAGRHAEAIDAFDTALALLEQTGDRHHEGQVLANLGTVHRKVGGTEAARFCWSRALERLEPGTPESERTAELLGVR